MMKRLTGEPTLSDMLSLAHREIIALAARDLDEYDELAGERHRLVQALGGRSERTHLIEEPGARQTLDELRDCDAQIGRDLRRFSDELSDRAADRSRLYAFPRLYLSAPGPGRSVEAESAGSWS